MKKTRIFFLFFIFSTLTVFAQNSLVPIEFLTKTENNYTRNDISAQIALREALVSRNISEIKYINLQRIRVIERDNLSWWERRSNVQVIEYNRQINELNDENNRYKREISRLNQVLRKLR